MSGWYDSCHPFVQTEFVTSTDAYEGSNAAKLTIYNGGKCAVRIKDLYAVVESGTYTISVYTKVYEAPREIPPDEIFAMEIGNYWTYDSNIEREVTAIDTTSFDKDAYEMTIYENDIEIEKEWYEVWRGYLRNWGLSDSTIMFEFGEGLLVSWFPQRWGL